ncbi:MAG: preprotein translocase subunit SecE [bacterium]|nr:preprotein translocase subunit SecE [bacterium]
MSNTEGNEATGIGAGVSFTKESWAELKKVTFPTKQETIQTTLVVLVMMVLVAAYLGLLDLVFYKLMQAFL